MGKIKRTLAIMVIFVALWVISNDAISAFNILTGVLLCALSIYVSCKLLNIDYTKEFSLPIVKTARYILFLITSIYKAGFIATLKILTGDIDPYFTKVEIDSDIKNSFLHNIIANSVTLTPGTITVENNKGKLTVLCLHKASAEKSPIEDFEPFMKGIQQELNKK